MKRLEGRVAIVTGATRTFGEAIARRLAEDGAAIIGVGRSTSAGEAVAARIREGGGRAAFLQTDVAQEEQVERAVAAAVRAFGRLDIVVNNAAATDVLGGGQERAAVDEPTEIFDRFIKVGLYGPFWFCKYAIPEMTKHGGGAFVNISSAASQRAVPSFTGYGASKAGLEALTRQIAVDYGAKGIRSNALLVGAIRAPHSAAFFDHQAVKAQILPSLCIPRYGEPADVANVVAFLASDESAYITGAVIPVDGGGTARSAGLDLGRIFEQIAAPS
jgi:NAD(P)-dependent dehydrogenase (short-subunit alcohol dehydrogenase family)